MTQTAGATKTFPVFDSDSHVVEPPAVWDEYLDSAYRVMARTWFWHESGAVGPHTVLNGRPVPELPTPNLPRHAIWRPGMTPRDVGALDASHRHEPNPGASDPQARLKDMDAMGVDQALLFPTRFLEYFPLVENPDVARALAAAYNDWVLDFCGAAPGRLFPVAVLPLQDVNFAVGEVRRVKALGFKAALVRPVFSNDRYPVDEYYRPVWQELAAGGIAAWVHPSAGPAAQEPDANAPFVERVALNLGIGHPVAEFVAPPMDNAAFVVAMMADGLLERYPDLRVGFTHSGTGWLTLALEKTETYLWLSPRQAEPVSLEPEDLFFNRQTFIAFNSGDGTIRRMHGLFEKTGVWSSHYPNHDTASAWEGITYLQEGGAPGSAVESMFGANVARALGVTAQVHVAPSG